MKLFQLVFLLFLASALGKPKTIDKTVGRDSDFVNEEIATPELFGLLIKARDTTLKALKELMTFENVSSPRDGAILCISELYYSLSLFVKVGEMGKLSPYLVYWIADAILEVVEYDGDLSKPKLRFDKNFRKNLKERLKVNTKKRYQNPFDYPDADTWTRDLLHLQEMAMAQMHRSVNHYETIDNLYNGKAGLVFLFDQFLENIPPKDTESGTMFDIWYEPVKECEDKYLKALCSLMIVGTIPYDTDYGFVKILLKLTNLKFPEFAAIDVRARVREEAFMEFPAKKEKRPFIKYMFDLKLKSTMTEISESGLLTSQRISICEGILKSSIYSMEKYWDANVDLAKRHSVVFLYNGIRYVLEMISELTRVTGHKYSDSFDHIPYHMVASTYAATMEVIGKCVVPFLPEAAQTFCGTTFEAPKTVNTGFSKGPLMKLEVMEGYLANLLETMDVDLVRTLYRLLLFAKTLTFMTDYLLRYVKAKPVDCPECTHLFQTTSQEYLEKALNDSVLDIMQNNSAQMNQFFVNVYTSLTVLSTSLKPDTNMSPHFYEFLREKYEKNSGNQIWNLIYSAVQNHDIDGTENVVSEPFKTRLRKITPEPKAKSKSAKVNKKKKKAIPRKTSFVEDDSEMVVRNNESTSLVLIPREEIVEHNEEKQAEESDLKLAPQKKKRKIEKHFDLIKSVVSSPLELISNVLDPLPLLKEKLPSYVIPRPTVNIRHSRTHTITYHAQEPTHHLIAAKTLGYKEPSSIDPRDYLMVHLLIGQRIWAKVLRPLLDVLEQFESHHHLIKSFKTSVETFKQDFELLRAWEKETWTFIMNEARIKDVNWLYKCLDYYHKRTAIAHPKIPNSDTLRSLLISRYLSTLELNKVLDPVQIRRLQKEFQCPNTIETKKIDTRTRPTSLVATEETETALAVIWMWKVSSNDKIKVTRRLHAHKEVSDQEYRSYIDYIFGDHEDHKFLSEL